jgi:hypothetical protein
MLRIRDPVLFYPWIRDGKKSVSEIRDPRSGIPIQILEHVCDYESLVMIVGFKLLEFCVSSFVADPDPGSRIDPETGIDIDMPVSATLVPDL